MSETEDDVAPVRRLFASVTPGELGLAPRQPRHLRSPARGFPDHRLLLRMIDAIRMTSSDETEFVTNLRRALRLLFRHEHGVDPSDEDSEEIDDIIRKELEFYRYRQTLPPLDGGP